MGRIGSVRSDPCPTLLSTIYHWRKGAGGYLIA